MALLCPGNAGSNTGTDHVTVLDAAIGQIPAPHRRNLLVTIDGDGAGHQIVDHITALNARHGHRVEYSIGFDLDDRARTAITRLRHDRVGTGPGRRRPAPRRRPRRRTDRPAPPLRRPRRPGHRPTVHLADKTCGSSSAVNPSPSGCRSPCSKPTTATATRSLATNTPRGHLQRLEARHRVHARVEDGVRNAKATGLRRLPSKSWGINEAWCQVVALAVDLLAWTRHLTLTGELAKAEPKTMRYSLLHTAARITRGQRHRWLNIPNGTDGKTFENTYGQRPTSFILDSTYKLDGLVNALVGTPVGSRILLAVPPEDGFGLEGLPAAGIGPTDTIVLVVDLRSARVALQRATGTAVKPKAGLPTVTFDKAGKTTVSLPKGSPLTSLVAEPLIKGSGAKVSRGQ